MTGEVNEEGDNKREILEYLSVSFEEVKSSNSRLAIQRTVCRQFLLRDPDRAHEKMREKSGEQQH